jgi:hypothetical protein
MAKISRDGGPSDAYANPGDTAVDAMQRVSSLHPAEQGALPLHGERDDSQWLTEEGEAPSPGNNSSASSAKQSNTDETTTESRPPARTTESPSAQDREDSSTARMTGTGTKDSKPAKK